MENSVGSDNISNVEPLRREPSAASIPSQIHQNPVQHPPKDQKAIIDPTTVMQLQIMYHKLNYIGMQVDTNRIKISSHKVIKREDYLNLSQDEIDKEQYYRGGTRPKKAKEDETTEGKVKYTIFQARNKRILLLRKPEGGRYEVFNKNSFAQPERLHPETANHIKRIKMSEGDEFEGVRHTVNPALQYEVKKTFGDCYNIDDVDSDENMTDDESKNDVDDYTQGFIERYRKRRGNKRSGNMISVRVNNS